MPLKKRWGPTVFLTATVLLLWLVWNKFQSLSLTCAVLALSIPCLALIHAPQEAPLPLYPGESPVSGRRSQFFFGLAGLVLAWLASRAGLAGRLLPMSGCVLGAALAFRLTTFEPLPTPKARTLTFLALGLVVLGALFRLWRAGAVPVGECGSDESQIWGTVWSYFDGRRLTYDPANGLGADGIIPIYMIMAGLKVFGSSMLGWRLEGILCGIGLTALLYRLGKESLGVWVGLGAAFFWAVSVWPVTDSRAVYYMTETTLLVVACLTLLTLGLRKGGAWRFAAAGVLWALCFNAYPAARVMLALVPWLYTLLWLFERHARPTLKRSAAPLLSGFFVGIAPLILWLFLSYPESVREYFVGFTASQESGGLASVSLLGKTNEAFSRVIGAFPASWRLLTAGGIYPPHYFPQAYPMLEPCLFGLAVLGGCVALARFRNAFCSFLLYWWFFGLLPSLATGNEGTDRRLLMTLAPTLLLAALGVETIAQVARTLLGKTRSAALVLAAAGLVAASAYGLTSWRHYFVRNQRDPALLVDGLAQYADMNRTLHADLGSGGVLISTLRYSDGSFYGGMYDNRIEAIFNTMLRGVPVFHYQGDPYTYDSGGVQAALKWALAQAPAKGPNKVYILLMPFYDYLAPGLKDIGAVQVAEFQHLQTSQGPLATGRDADPTHFARLLVIQNLNKAAVDRYAARPIFEEKVGEVSPPHGWTRASIRALKVSDPSYEPLVRAYAQGKWHQGRTVSYKTDDPWFWTAAGSLPGGIAVPYNLKMRTGLSISQAGDYAFGASATLLTTIKVDGKTVFSRDPFDAAAVAERAAEQAKGNPDTEGMTWWPDTQDRRGFLGRAVHLNRGEHILEIDQAFLSRAPNPTHVLRPIWQAPGQKTETLPLELLRTP